MAIDPNNLSGVAEGYETPQQIQQRYEYAKALMGGATRDDTITSPWQGLRMLMDSYSAAKQREKAGQQEMFSRTEDQKTTPRDPWADIDQGRASSLPGIFQTPPNMPGTGVYSPTTAPQVPASPPVSPAPPQAPQAPIPYNTPGMPGTGAVAGLPQNNMVSALMTQPPNWAAQPFSFPS